MTREKTPNMRELSDKDRSFLEQTVKKAESWMRQGFLRFSTEKVVYFNPGTKAFVLFGYVGPKITYVYGCGEKMDGQMTWPARYAVNFEGVEESERELRLKFSGQYEGYGEFMYDAEDIVLKKKQK